MSYNKMMKRALLAGVATATLAGAMPAVSTATAYAQDYTTGILRGTVQDTTGSVVAGATVVISSNRGVNQTAVTDANGNVRMPRLPIGNYTVTVSHDGHETLSDQNVYISVGEGNGVTFTMAIPGSDVEEIVVSGTAVGNWDFNSTTTGISVNVGDLFDKTPIGRDATSVALLAPGAGLGDTSFASGQYGSSGNNASFGGSSVGENAYYINGMNTTNFRNAIGSSTIPFEFYEHMEVKTGGYQAEFGRSTGGVMNAVTKSGSNELHFGANVFWEPDALYEDSPNTFAATNSSDVTSKVEYNFWVSGAIVEDKLFFYGLYNPRNFKQTDCGLTRCTSEVRNEPFYGAKIDFVPFDGHRFEYTYFSDAQDADQEVLAFDGVETIGQSFGVGTYKNGGDNHIFKYTGVLADWFTISGMYGENNYARGRTATIDSSVITEYRNGSPTAQGDSVVGSLFWNKDKRVAKRLDADFYFDLAGEHHIRAGWDEEELTATEFTRYSGNVALRYYNSTSSSTGERVRTRQYWNEGNFQTTQSAYYIQDSWQATDDLMLNIGFRNETFDNRNAEGDTFVKSKNQKAMRVGFSWDPTGDGSNRIYGSWGRYFLPIATNTNIRMAGAEFYVQQYYELPAGWDADTPYLTAGLGSHVDLAADPTTWYTTADGAPLVLNGGTSVYGDGTQAGTHETTDANLKPMFQDEWIVGFDHDFGNGWSMGVNYVHRKLGRLIEDIAIDAGVPIWAAANGYDAVAAASVWSGFHQYVLTNPGGTVTVGTTDLVNLDGSDPGLVVMELTPDMLPYPEGKRKYDAVNITFSREWDGKWSLDGSYTWSKSIGNTEGSVKSDNGQDDAGLTTDFDQPGFTHGAYGYLPNDRRHRIKLWGAYQVNDWLTVGGKMVVESPRKQGCVGENAVDSFAYWYGAASWYCGGELTPRASQMETDWTKTFDLSFSMTPKISEDMPGDLNFRIDVFNVFNSKAIADRWEVGDLGFTSDLAFGGTTLPDPDPDYGKPTRFQTPRHIRFSASYTF